MIGTKSKKTRIVALFAIVILAMMAFFATYGFAAAETKVLSFPVGQEKISIPVEINESEAYAGLDFAVSCSSGLTFTGVDFDANLSNTVSAEKDGVYHFGYYAQTNRYQGKQTLGTLNFTYKGNGEETVTITEIKIGRVNADNEVDQTIEKDSLKYTIKRTSSSTPGGSTSDSTQKIVIGEEETPLTAPTLSDIAGHWAEQDILSAVAKGFVTGYTDGTFKPNNPVSRAEFVTMLVKANAIESGTKNSTFSDVASHWALTSIMTAASNEYISGYPDGTFKPDNKINRQEVAKIMAGFKALSETDVTLPFNDAKSIGAWAVPSVKMVYQAEIMKGNTSNNFAPLANTTRAEAVAIILRCMD